MTLPRWLPWLGLAAVGYLGWLGVRHGIEAEGALKQQIKEREQTIAVMAKSIQSYANRIQRVDTVAGKAKTVYVAAKVDYEAIRDSLLKEMAGKFHSDTADEKIVTPLIRACNLALAAADSALGGCSRQVAIRDTALAKKDTLLAQQDTLIRDLRKRARGFRLLGVPLACVGGYVGTVKAAGPGIGCGVPLLK